LTDRLRRLLGDPELRRRMGVQGQEIARRRYTDTAMARRYEDIYARMVNWWQS